MPTPTPSWGTHRVFGTWNNLDGTRKPGNYVASLATRVTNATDDVIVPIGIVATGSLNTVNLAAASLDINVPANDDPDNTPNDWLISLTVTFADAPPETYVLDTPLGGSTNLRTIIFPQAISGDPVGYLRGVPNGIAGLDADGDVIDADGVKVVASGPAVADLDDVPDSATRIAFTPTEKTKLAGVATGATANSPNATLLSRANHTGTQTSATISDFTEAAQDAIATLLAAGTGITLSYNDAGNSLSITNIASADAEAIQDVMGAAMVGVGVVSVTYNDVANTITVTSTATANSTDAALRDRSTHTGTQAFSTITGVTLDALPLSVPGTVTWTGSAWPARSTVTSQTTRRVIFVGNPGGSGPSDAQPNDVWTAG